MSVFQTVRRTLDDDEPCIFFKKGNRVNESYEKNSTMNAEPSWRKVQHVKNSSGKRQNKPQVPRISSQLKSSLVATSQQAEDEPPESTYPQGKLGRSPLSPRCQGASGNKLFLDFESMRIFKEDADEDSGSDLSDSERIPIHTSPLTPPDLQLRAEEINPACFRRSPDQDHSKPGYCYPDFLPPPFNSWNLQDMAVLLNSEGKLDAVPRAGGLLRRYINRLVQLEWLQIQTVQTEKGKGAKTRPPVAPGTSWALKSPRRRKLIAAALPKPLPQQEGASKPGPSQKKDLRQEDTCRYVAFQTSPRPADARGSSRSCSKKQVLEVRREGKKRKIGKGTELQRLGLVCGDELQRRGLACGDGSSRIHTSGDLGIPKPSGMILDLAVPCKAPGTQAHAHLKKKGNASNGSRANTSSEKNLETNGVKQSTDKFE
ncbi:protein FAM217B isoform X1 [Trichechus manatus latirostris]|uniref:Protein FAM217B isoform X1 n=2 Tax=Trichechus manatus latirostris TaxID=127582 RepID=A0A2Y9S1Y2_TRIMA|nr:protein FAM217B isoform X1 [Trichechus manatus latirostris]